MKYFGLILSNLRRKPLRTGFTAASLMLAFLLYGLLEPVVQVFESGLGQVDGSRMWVSPRGSISDMLPARYVQQVERIAGVNLVAHQTWFGGTFKDPAVSSTFTRWAVSAKEFMDLHPELIISDQQLSAFISTRTGMIVGQTTASRFDMKVGDKIPLLADIWHNEDGSYWEFDLVGIYTAADRRVNTTRMFVNYDFFDEYRIVGKGLVSNILLSINDPKQATKIASDIDGMFANSSMETKTVTEQQYALNFIRQIGNVALIVRSIMAAVFFTLLLLTANTMSQAMRERIPELAVLKTLGFPNSSILLLVLAESLLLIGLAATSGLALAMVLLKFSDLLIPQLSELSLGTESLFVGFLAALILTLLVGVPPAVKAMRLNIVDALQRA